MKKFISILVVIILVCTMFAGCVVSGSQQDVYKQKEVSDALAIAQETPSDINYSLERYNLIRRAYWVNGQREKANALTCEIQKPLGYVILFSGNTVVGNFVVDGKVSSLNSFLTPSEAYINGNLREMADVDGSYGENDAGIFFFTVDGKYIEWTGTYLYSDIPFEVDDPVLKMEVSE